MSSLAERSASRGALAQELQTPPSFLPAKSDLTQNHIEDLYIWQDSRFPNGEPLARQGNQFKQELGEVGELVFGVSPEALDNLPQDKKTRVAEEITDVVIAGVGKLKVLGHSYEELRKRKETAIYDSSKVSDLEKWQIDANGGETPVSIRMQDFAGKALISHRTYDQLGTQNVNDLTSDQKLELSQRITETMTSGLSVLNGMGESFDKHFKKAYEIMNEKYDLGLLQQLEAEGWGEEERMAEAKRRHKRRFREIHTGENILYTADMVSNAA